jgi:hypothetical protein
MRLPRPVKYAFHDRRLATWFAGICAVGICAGAIITTASGALSGNSVRPRAFVHPPVGSVGAAVATAVPAELAGRLTAFQRTQHAGDPLPSDLETADLRANAAHPTLARLAGSFHGHAVYLVPEAAGMCLASDSFLVYGCYSSADVLNDAVQVTVACFPFMPAGQQETFGILPGASNMAATYSDGSVKPVSLMNDVFVIDGDPASGPYPVTMSWDDASGHHMGATAMHVPSAGVPPCASPPNGATPSQAIARERELIREGRDQQQGINTGWKPN